MAFDPVAAFAEASSAQELPAVASAAAKSLIGVTGFSCAVAEGDNLSLAPGYGWFEAVSLESFSELQRRAGQQIREAMRTVIAALKSTSTCLDVIGLLGRKAVRDSAIGEILLRPCDIERVLLGLPHHEGKLVAVVAVYRSLRDRSFSARDRLQLERICDLFAERAAALTAPSGHQSLATLLEAIEDHLPHSFAGLFDGDGRMIWLSERSASRLGAVAQRHGTRRILVPRSDELEALRARARAACQQTARRRGQRAAVDLIWPRERLLVRRVEQGDGQPAVLLFVPRSIDVPEMVDTSGRMRTHGLSRREAEVVELAIRGYSVANIAARLALGDQTIKTFLKRIYNKLQVRNRAELCYEVLRPRDKRT